MKDKNLVRVGANVLVCRNNQVLLSRRANTGWEDGKLCIPGGHSLERERPTLTAVREIKEELGLVVKPTRLQFLCVAARNSQPYEFASYEFILMLKADEKPYNAEPDRCSELVWCDPKRLPDDVIHDFRVIIEQGYLKQLPFLEIDYAT